MESAASWDHWRPRRRSLGRAAGRATPTSLSHARCRSGSVCLRVSGKSSQAATFGSYD